MAEQNPGRWILWFVERRMLESIKMKYLSINSMEEDGVARG